MTVAGTPPTYREASRELLRETAFDAARRLLGEQPWSKVPMSRIATQTGVSRQTLYNEFGNREQFGQALILHEAERFVEGVEAAMRSNFDDPERAMVAALRHFLAAAESDPLVRALVSDEGDGGLLPLVTTRGLPTVNWAAGRIAGVIAEGWPEIADRDAALLAGTLVRLAISHVTTPAGSADRTARETGRLLVPFLDQALGRNRS